MNLLTIPFILVTLALFGAAYFGYWAYQGRQDYKNNVDQKIAATQVSNQQLTATLNAQYAQQAKSPYKTYYGPSAFGSLLVVYPENLERLCQRKRFDEQHTSRWLFLP